MDWPARPANVGKTCTIHSIDGVPQAFVVEDEVVVPQGDGSKLIYLQKLRRAEGKDIEYRFTYYMIGVKPARRGTWVFGQYSLMVPAKELNLVLTEARKRGWVGF